MLTYSIVELYIYTPHRYSSISISPSYRSLRSKENIKPRPRPPPHSLHKHSPPLSSSPPTPASDAHERPPACTWTNYTQAPGTSQQLWPVFSSPSATREKTPLLRVQPPPSKQAVAKRHELSRQHPHNHQSTGFTGSLPGNPFSPPKLTEPPHVSGCSLPVLRQPAPPPKEMDVTVTRLQAGDYKRMALVRFGRGGSSREELRELCRATWGGREPRPPQQPEKKGQLLSGGRLHPVLPAPVVRTRPKFVIDGEAVPGASATGPWGTGDGQEEEAESMYSLEASLPTEMSFTRERGAADEVKAFSRGARPLSPNGSIRINRDYIRVLNDMHRVDVLLSCWSKSSARSGRVLSTGNSRKKVQNKWKQTTDAFKLLPPWPFHTAKMPPLVPLSQQTNHRLQTITRHHPV